MGAAGIALYRGCSARDVSGGGVGVSLAVQDAVATANLLFDKFGNGGPSLADLEKIQERRSFPVRVTQGMQVIVQNNLINRAISENLEPPLVMKLVTRFPGLQGITARHRNWCPASMFIPLRRKF